LQTLALLFLKLTVFRRSIPNLCFAVIFSQLFSVPFRTQCCGHDYSLMLCPASFSPHPLFPLLIDDFPLFPLENDGLIDFFRHLFFNGIHFLLLDGWLFFQVTLYSGIPSPCSFSLILLIPAHTAQLSCTHSQTFPRQWNLATFTLPHARPMSYLFLKRLRVSPPAPKHTLNPFFFPPGSCFPSRMSFLPLHLPMPNDHPPQFPLPDSSRFVAEPTTRGVSCFLRSFFLVSRRALHRDRIPFPDSSFSGSQFCRPSSSVPADIVPPKSPPVRALPMFETRDPEGPYVLAFKSCRTCPSCVCLFLTPQRLAYYGRGRFFLFGDYSI